MPSAVGGGQSWLVGKSPSTGEETGVQVRPSFGPPLHLFPVGSQIGHGWMNVRHLAPVPGQSAPIMHPLPSFVPPTHAPVSHEAVRLQLASEQQAAPLSVHRPVSLTQVPPPAHATVVPQPPPPVQLAPGVVPPEHRIGMRSPVRKIPELSGRLRAVVLPTLQSALPVAFAVIVLRTHVLVAAPVCEEFGIGSG